jgi:hypothetical protein
MFLTDSSASKLGMECGEYSEVVKLGDNFLNIQSIDRRFSPGLIVKSAELNNEINK